MCGSVWFGLLLTLSQTSHQHLEIEMYVRHVYFVCMNVCLVYFLVGKKCVGKSDEHGERFL